MAVRRVAGHCRGRAASSVWKHGATYPVGSAMVHEERSGTATPGGGKTTTIRPEQRASIRSCCVDHRSRLPLQVTRASKGEISDDRQQNHDHERHGQLGNNHVCDWNPYFIRRDWQASLFRHPVRTTQPRGHEELNWDGENCEFSIPQAEGASAEWDALTQSQSDIHPCTTKY